MYVVTIKGSSIPLGCSILGYIPEVDKLILQNIRKVVAQKCNLRVMPFMKVRGKYIAFTSDKKVDVVLEEVDEMKFDENG